MQVVALGDARRSSLGGTTAGSVELAGTRPQAPAFTPGGILLGHFAVGLALRNVLDLLLVGQAQYLAHLQLVDVVADEGIRVQRLDCDHGLLDRATLRVARGNLPQGVAALGGVAAGTGCGRCHIACSRLVALGLGLVKQHAVVAQQAALRPHHLNQELDHRPRQRLAGGNPQHAFAVGVDHRCEGQVFEVGRKRHPGLAELFRWRQARRHFGGFEVAHIEQFDLGVQRLILCRLQGQLPQAQRIRHARRQRRCCSHGQNQFANSKHDLFPCMNRPETCMRSRTKVLASIFYGMCLINNCATCTALSAAPLRTLSVVSQRLSCWSSSTP